MQLSRRHKQYQDEYRDPHQLGKARLIRARTASLNLAWIQLSGLHVGKDEISLQTRLQRRQRRTIDTNVDQYYFDAGNRFSAVVSLEERAGTAGMALRPLPSIFFAVGEVERDERAFFVQVLDFKWVLKSAR